MLEFTSKNTPWQKEKLTFPWSYLHWKTSEFWRIWCKTIALNICFTFTYHFWMPVPTFTKTQLIPIEITTKKNHQHQIQKNAPPKFNMEPQNTYIWKSTSFGNHSMLNFRGVGVHYIFSMHWVMLPGTFSKKTPLRLKKSAGRKIRPHRFCKNVGWNPWFHPWR